MNSGELKLKYLTGVLPTMGYLRGVFWVQTPEMNSVPVIKALEMRNNAYPKSMENHQICCSGKVPAPNPGQA